MLARPSETAPGAPQAPDGAIAPRWLAYAIAAVVTALVSGALYLIVVRGEALVLDLAKLGRMFCF